MSYEGKLYKHQRDENFREFLESLGIPESFVEHILNLNPSQKLEKDGDDYVYTSIDNDRTRVMKFKNGVEFDEPIRDGVVAKTTFTIDGDVLMQVQKYPEDKTVTMERHYNDKELVVELKTNFWEGSAKRYYSAD